jgi:hypothetical protein
VRYLSGKWSQAILGLTVSSKKSDVGASWGVCTDRVRQKKLSATDGEVRSRLSESVIKSSRYDVMVMVWFDGVPTYLPLT